MMTIEEAETVDMHRLFQRLPPGVPDVAVVCTRVRARARPSATMRHAPACVLQCVCVHAALVNTSSQHAAGRQGRFQRLPWAQHRRARRPPAPRMHTAARPCVQTQHGRRPQTHRARAAAARQRPHLQRRSAQQEAAHHHTAPHAQRTLRHPRPTARAPYPHKHTHAPDIPRPPCPTCACTVPRPPGTETAHHTVRPRVQRHPPLRAHPATAGGRSPSRRSSHTRLPAAAAPLPCKPPPPPAGAGTDLQ